MPNRSTTFLSRRSDRRGDFPSVLDRMGSGGATMSDFEPSDQEVDLTIKFASKFMGSELVLKIRLDGDTTHFVELAKKHFLWKEMSSAASIESGLSGVAVSNDIEFFGEEMTLVTSFDQEDTLCDFMEALDVDPFRYCKADSIASLLTKRRVLDGPKFLKVLKPCEGTKAIHGVRSTCSLDLTEAPDIVSLGPISHIGSEFLIGRSLLQNFHGWSDSSGFLTMTPLPRTYVTSYRKTLEYRHDSVMKIPFNDLIERVGEGYETDYETHLAEYRLKRGE